jgi:hypothetical protein
LHLISAYASRTSAYALNKKRKILDSNKNGNLTVFEKNEVSDKNNGFEALWCLSDIKMRINERNFGSYERADSLSVTHTIILIEKKLFQKLKWIAERNRKIRTNLEIMKKTKISTFFSCLKKIVFYSRSRNQILDNSVKFSLVLFLTSWKAALVTKKTGSTHTGIHENIMNFHLRN